MKFRREKRIEFNENNNLGAPNINLKKKKCRHTDILVDVN